MVLVVLLPLRVTILLVLHSSITAAIAAGDKLNFQRYAGGYDSSMVLVLLHTQLCSFGDQHYWFRRQQVHLLGLDGLVLQLT